MICSFNSYSSNDANHAIYRWRGSSDILTSNMIVESVEIAVVRWAKQSIQICTLSEPGDHSSYGL